MLLVFYAFPREIAVLKRRLGSTVAALDRGQGLDGFRAAVEGFGAAVFVATGIGPRRAREAARRALSVFPKTRLVIGTGVAGALADGLAPGDLVLADRVLSAREEPEDRNRHRRGAMPSEAIAEDGAHPERTLAIGARERSHCARVLRSAGLAFSTGAILTSHRVLAHPHAKHAARAATGAIAADMESAELAFEAAARGVPFAVVRAIMDAAEDEVFGGEIVGGEGRVRPLAAAAYLAAHPRAFVKIPRMMRDLGRAAKALAAAIAALGATPFPPG